MPFVIILVLSIFTNLSLWSQTQSSDIEKMKVEKIQVEGVQKVEPEALLSKITIKENESFSMNQVSQSIKNIYTLNYFDQVSAYISEDKKTLIFRVIEREVILKIEFAGNDGLSSEDLQEQIKTKEYNILDESKVMADTQALTKFYEEKGYFLAEVNYEVEKLETGGVKLIFKINEFDKVVVKKITFLGNKALSDDEIKGFMQTREESLFSGLSGSGGYKDLFFKADIERIKYLYKTRGYLQVNVDSPVVTVSPDKKWIFITLQVKEGPQYTVNDVFYDGEILFSSEKMMELTSLKKDEIYSEEKLRKDIQALTELYQDDGYAFANVLRNLRIVPGENKVDIIYSFEKGEKAYFGRIDIQGNTRTRDKVLRRELRIHEGMLYSGSKLRISKENVNRLGFFEQGSVVFNTVSRRGQSNILDVEISVQERQTGQISLGAGWSSATNAFFQASIAQNNFRGLGQNLNLNINHSDFQSTYNIGFTEPYFLDTLWTAGGDIYRNQNNFIRSFQSDRYGADLRVGYPFNDYTRIFLTLRHEETNISRVRNPTIDPNIENGVAATTRVSLRYDKRNNVFEPTDGFFANTTAEYAGFYGDQEWLKFSFESRYYKPIWEDLVFRTRLITERVFQTTDRAIPRTEKFQMGGPRNMRGFNFEDIGPQRVLRNEITGLDEQFNIGGVFSFLTTFELEHPLVKEAGLKWVLFYDAGNVFEKPLGENDDESLRANYGFGFRWFSPIGVLRFEFGYPVNPKPNEQNQQFHFDIGQLF